MKTAEIKLVVGLGNPGAEYKGTRHNVGFMVLEKLAKINSVNFRKSKKIQGQITEIGYGEQKQRLLMPDTFMNASGLSVRLAMDWFGLEKHQLLVLADDMDLPLGRIRLRAKGSSGGHNGIKSIIQHTGSQNFKRLKIGIGAPSLIANERKRKTTNHVLGSFNSKEFSVVQNVIQEVIDGILLLESSSWDKAMTHINSYKKEIS